MASLLTVVNHGSPQLPLRQWRGIARFVGAGQVPPVMPWDPPSAHGTVSGLCSASGEPGYGHPTRRWRGDLGESGDWLVGLVGLVVSVLKYSHIILSRIMHRFVYNSACMRAIYVIQYMDLSI